MFLSRLTRLDQCMPSEQVSIPVDEARPSVCVLNKSDAFIPGETVDQSLPVEQVKRFCPCREG